MSGSNEKKQEFVCCICGRKFTGWGNDPWPVNTKEDARCCDECNGMYVIPARIKQITEGK